MGFLRADVLFSGTIIGARAPGVKRRGRLRDPIEFPRGHEPARDRYVHRLLLGRGEPRRSAVLASRTRGPAPGGEDPRHDRGSARRGAHRARADPRHRLRRRARLVHRPAHRRGRDAGARARARHRSHRRGLAACLERGSGERCRKRSGDRLPRCAHGRGVSCRLPQGGDRKSTRLNSSHLVISYAVFCLKKKKFQALATTSFSPIRYTYATSFNIPLLVLYSKLNFRLFLIRILTTWRKHDTYCVLAASPG